MELEILYTQPSSNVTPFIYHHCSRDEVLQQCYMPESEKGKRDALAGLRLVVSSLSLLGASSIIYSAIRKKRVCSSKVHPLFVLSIADVMLAVLWGVGSALWLGQTENMKRGWCFSVSLLTIIIECVAINLTFMYAFLAYQHIKKLGKSNKQSQLHYGHRSVGVLTAGNETEEEPRSRKWYYLRTSLMYCIAWLVPVIVVMVPFAFMVRTGNYHILDHVKDCACWCQPEFGNIVPFSVPSTNASARYVFELHKILLLYGVVISVHYLVVFVALVVCYMMILRHIQKLNKKYNEYHGSRRYGAIKVQIKQVQSQARRRVVAFIIVFIITGFFNLVLSVLFLQHEVTELVQEDVNNLPLQRRRHELPIYVYSILYMQSLTVPLQGFLNALVYGWTRDDFVNEVVTRTGNSTDASHQNHHEFETSRSNYEDSGDDQKCLVQTVPSPEGLSGSTNAQIFSDEVQTDFETDDELKAYKV